MKNMSAQALRAFGEQAFQAAGLKKEAAEIVTDGLIYASLCGVDTHGVVRYRVYIERLKKGYINPKAEPEWIQRSPNCGIVDGHNGIGIYVADRAVRETIRMAKETGIGCTAVCGSNHFSAAGYYTHLMAEEGLIGFVCSNIAAAVPPFGAKKAFFGTNPVSYGFPAGKYPPILHDMATSIVSQGKIRLAADHNHPIPEGWAMDQDGRPTTDPKVALKSRSILPFGGAKGSGIAMLAELLSTVLTTALFSKDVPSMFGPRASEAQNLGHFFMALNPEAFCDRGAYNARMEHFVEEFRLLEPDAQHSEVLLPGEIEWRTKQQRERDGIPVDDELWATLSAVSELCNIPLSVS